MIAVTSPAVTTGGARTEPVVTAGEITSSVRWSQLAGLRASSSARVLPGTRLTHSLAALEVSRTDRACKRRRETPQPVRGHPHNVEAGGR